MFVHILTYCCVISQQHPISVHLYVTPLALVTTVITKDDGFCMFRFKIRINLSKVKSVTMFQFRNVLEISLYSALTF